MRELTAGALLALAATSIAPSLPASLRDAVLLATVGVAGPRALPAHDARPPHPARRVGHEVPLTGDGRHLIVEGILNDTVRGPMLVDTGASYCVLTHETARRLGLTARPARSIPVATANGEIAARLVTLDSLRLEGAQLVAVDALILDAVQPPLIGIVGLSFLKSFRYSVDHRRGTLHLER